MKARFAHADTWSGGFYELAIELGERCDTRLSSALEACWHYPALEGCYLNSKLEPHTQERVLPMLSHIENYGHLHGVATLTDGERIPCGTVAIREDYGGPDWFDFYIPLGALSDTYEEVGGYPFGDQGESRSWREPLDKWLAQLGQHIYSITPYRLGLIGYEVSGCAYADDIIANGVSEERGICCLVPSKTGLTVYGVAVW